MRLFVSALKSGATSTDVYGCTDVNANNYNPNATIDDGSCTYPLDAPTGIEVTEVVVGNESNFPFTFPMTLY